jgi:hypothetical protein
LFVLKKKYSEVLIAGDASLLHAQPLLHVVSSHSQLISPGPCRRWHSPQVEWSAGAGNEEGKNEQEGLV